MLQSTIPKILIAQKIVSERIQKDYFRKLEAREEVPEFEIYTPTFMTEKARVRAVFIEPGALHVVYNDEVFPLNDRVDERYRELRKEVFGRTADVESLRVSRGQAILPSTSALPNPFFESSLHGYDTQPWTGRLFKSTWNGLISTLPNPFFTFKGGYVKATYELRHGNREDAIEYAKNL